MGPDLDFLDDFLPGTAAKPVRVGTKFQPKLRPRKASTVVKSPVQSFDKAEEVVSVPTVTNELSASPVHALEDQTSLDCVNKSLDHAVAGEAADIDASLNNSEFLNVSIDSPLNGRKSTGVNVDAYFGLESLECSLPATAADTAVKDSKQSTRTTLPGDQKLSEVDEPQDYFGADIECADRTMGEKDDNGAPCLEISDDTYELTTIPELQAGKFEPKSKVPCTSAKSSANDSISDRVESASHMQEPPSAVSSDEFILDEFSYTFPENNAEFHPYTSLESMSELPEINESLNEDPPVNISQEDLSFSAMDAMALKVAIEGDERIESEKAVNNDDDSVSVKCKRKQPAKSKRSVSQKGKSVSKRTRDHENPDEPTKKIPKRLPHSTRRPKRQVNKALLETPEEELDLQQISIRDIILLAEHREKLEKNGKLAAAHSTNPSASNSTPQYMRDETASEQAGFNNEETAPPVQDGCAYTNYHSYMERTPRVKWSKQDNELFYQAVRQFGSDLSFIQQLFPGRTRTQIKLKYKKEERQNPMMLHDALTGRAKDNSHFEHLIKLLKKDQDDSADLASNENLCGPEISVVEMEKSEQVAEKTEPKEQVEKVEPEKKEKEEEVETEEAIEQAVSEIRSSSAKYYYESEDDDDDGNWGIYNSDI